MPIQFRCNSCQKLLKVPDDSGGKGCKCPHCGEQMKVPLPSTPVAPGPAAQVPVPSNPVVPPGSVPGTPAQGPGTSIPSSAGTPQSSYPMPPGYPGKPTHGTHNPYSAPQSTPGPQVPMMGGGQMKLPHRGGLIVGLGVTSLISGLVTVLMCPCCAPIGLLTTVVALSTGIPAWIMASQDVKSMHRGTMDASGIGSTKTGKVCAIIGIVMCVIGIVLSFALFILAR